MRRIIWNSLETTLRNVQTVAELKAWRKRLQIQLRTSRRLLKLARGGLRDMRAGDLRKRKISNLIDDIDALEKKTRLCLVGISIVTNRIGNMKQKPGEGDGVQEVWED